MRMRGIDQTDIVNALGISASTVSDWVKGKKYPRVDSMQRLADFLGVLLSDLTIEKQDDISELLPKDPHEAELLQIYRDLNPRGQDALMRQARYLHDDPEMKIDSASNTTAI